MSRLYNTFRAGARGVTDQTRETWFAAAARGAAFLEKARRDDGTGLLYFSTTREGVGTHYQRRPYAAVFYMLACLEFQHAIKTRVQEGKKSDGLDPTSFTNAVSVHGFGNWPPRMHMQSLSCSEALCLRTDCLRQRSHFFLYFTIEMLCMFSDSSHRIALHRVIGDRNVQ